MKEFSLFLRRWLPVAIWAGAVVYASTSVGSGNHSAGLLRSILAWFDADLAFTKLTDLNFAIRKTAHVLQFVVYSLLVWRAMVLSPALEDSPWRITAWTLGSALALALSSEAIQMFSPFRNALFMDVLLDMSGAVLGAVIMLGVRGWSGRAGARVLLVAGWGMLDEPGKHPAFLDSLGKALRVSGAGTLIIHGGLGTPGRAGDSMRQLRAVAGVRTRIIVCTGVLPEAAAHQPASAQEILERFWQPACLAQGISCLEMGNVRIGRFVVCGGGLPHATDSGNARPDEKGAEASVTALERRVDEALPGPVLLISPAIPFEELQAPARSRGIDAPPRSSCDPRIGRLLVAHAPAILLSVSASQARQPFAKPVFGIPCLVLPASAESLSAVAFCPRTRTVTFYNKPISS